MADEDATGGRPTGRDPSGEWSAADGPIELVRLARVVGHLAWIERALHEAVGGWVPTTAEPDVAVAFDRLAQHHAGRSSVLVDRLPLLRELPRPELVVAPDGYRAVLDAMAGCHGSAARVDALGAVQAELLDTYRALVPRLTPVADAPLLRWLPVLSSDLATDVASLAQPARSSGGEEADAVRDLVDAAPGVGAGTGVRLA